MTLDRTSFDTQRHVKILVVWLVFTVLSAVTIIALFLTLPVLAALLAELFVRPRRTASALLAWVLGPMLMIGAG